jgi:hypothetical protein
MEPNEAKDAYFFQVQRRRDINEDITKNFQICFAIIAILVLNGKAETDVNFTLKFSYWIGLFLILFSIICNIIGYVKFAFKSPHDINRQIEYHSKLIEWDKSESENEFRKYSTRMWAENASAMHKLNLAKGHWNLISKCILIFAIVPLTFTLIQISPIPFP